MKIILSRKGFDQKAGGFPSPIMPDGTLVPLPIPQRGPIKYKDIFTNSLSVGKIVEDLTNRKVKSIQGAHLDPDLSFSSYPRLPGWRPLFGPSAAAYTHHMNQGVDVGDLFLFFGWFRETELYQGRYRYKRGAPNMHVIFGWMQLGKILNRDEPEQLPWADYHPHAGYILYAGRSRLNLNYGDKKVSGAGAIKKYREELCLTCPGQPNRSCWQLPKWFYPRNGAPPLSHHGNMSRWTLENKYTLLRTVGIGQEFVLDADKYPKSIPWAYELIANLNSNPK